jgi:peptidoglycan/LPS O-acetylase OafA/YrhL
VSPRYQTLDAWRGLAASCVVLNHLLGTAHLGHAAVMVFFVISGYCILAAATVAERRSLGFFVFMQRRFRRIYPPYLCSLVYFVLTRKIKAASGLGDQISRDPIAWLQNLTLTQWTPNLLAPSKYPTAGSSFVAGYWSLGYEEQFYLVVALAMVAAALGWLSLRVALGVVTVSAAAWMAFHPVWVHGIFLDYWTHFAVGALVFVRLSGALRRAYLADVGLTVVAIGAGLLALWLPAPADAFDRDLPLELYEVSTFGLVLIGLRRFDETIMRAGLGRALAKLGTISYSLYLLNQMNLRFVHAIATRILPATAPRVLDVVVELALHILVVVPFWWLCERPFRNAPLKTASQQ